MVINLRPLREDMSNVDWLNAVRNQAGWDYQRRIPEATQANVQDVVQNLFTYRPHMNQFIDTLVNRIGLVLFKNTIWTNPLAIFKRGTLEYGETIEEIMNGLLEAVSYDPDRDELEGEIFGAMTPEVQVNYHTLDRRDRYKLTIKQPLLRQAFLTPNGLGEFVTNLLGMASTSDQWDEYLLMMNLFKEMDKAGSMFIQNVPDVTLQSSTQADSQFVLRRLREFSNTLPFISRLYNPAGMPVAARPDDLVLFVKASAAAAMDVEALAGAFNISKAEFGSREIILPDTAFGIDGLQAVLTTKDFFVVADNLIETTSIQNPAALSTNYWLHHWEVISASRFAPQIQFSSTRQSTVITVPASVVTGVGTFTVIDGNGTTQATNVQRGDLYNVEVEAVTSPAGGPNDAVRYELDPTTFQSAFTRITNNGTLYIGPDEPSESITIQAYAVDTAIPQLLGTTSRTVVGDLIIPWPSPQVLSDSDDDGLLEVSPVKPGWNSSTNKITVPSEVGVQYKNGSTPVNNGTVITVANGTPVTMNAVARTGYELAAGATITWTFTYNTP